MKVKLLLALAVFASAALPANAHVFRHFGDCSDCCPDCCPGCCFGWCGAVASEGNWGPAGTGSPMQGGWQGGYYDVAWGMPLAVLVPPTARWQTNYAWGAGGTSISHIGPRFQYETSGPASAYRMGAYLPAPPQPSSTLQMGDYYVRGPRR